MDVFIAISKDYESPEAPIALATADAWLEIEDANPIILEITGNYELVRRITPENVCSDTFYILADLGCVAAEKNAISEIRKVLLKKDGMLGLSPAEDVPTGVRVIRRGVVSAWPSKSTDTYDQEHADAIKKKDKDVRICQSISYKRLQEC